MHRQQKYRIQHACREQETGRCRNRSTRLASSTARCFGNAIAFFPHFLQKKPKEKPTEQCNNQSKPLVTPPFHNQPTNIHNPPNRCPPNGPFARSLPPCPPPHQCPSAPHRQTLNTAVPLLLRVFRVSVGSSLTFVSR